MKIIQETRRAH